MFKGREDALNRAVDWLLKSIDKNTGGSRANYSILFNGLKGWSGPYPETTGYIIPTFLNLSNSHATKNNLFEKAERMGEWLLTLQFDDGAFPGNIYYRGKIQERSTFNTGQIILGLTALYDATKKSSYLESAKRAALWLVTNQSDDGTWKNFNYVNGFSPSYYTRVSWPILKVYQRTNDYIFKEAALKNLRSIQQRQGINSFIDGCGFQPGSYAFLHTIAYTIRGFIESAAILNDDELWQSGYSFAEKILIKFEVKHQLAGAYYPNFKSIDWYQCLTGNVQMAIIWLKVFLKTNDARFFSAASKAIDTVVDRQIKKPWNKNLIGAVAGSSPIFGRYMAMRYPNWAVKFLIDALMLEEQAFELLKNKF